MHASYEELEVGQSQEFVIKERKIALSLKDGQKEVHPQSKIVGVDNNKIFVIGSKQSSTKEQEEWENIMRKLTKEGESETLAIAITNFMQK